MEISKATRTHLVYQFIIVMLLFLGIGYNELLPDRKFIAFVAFFPIFSYQLIVLSCCMDLMPVPPWLSFLQISNAETSANEEKPPEEDFESSSSPVSSSKISRSYSKSITFPEIAEINFPRRWEKSVTDLGASPKCFVCPKKSKSWVNLSDSRSSERLSSQGSLDTLAPVTERISSRLQIRGDKVNREERAAKARSWKTGVKDFNISEESELAIAAPFSQKNNIDLPTSSNEDCEKHDDETALEKSYSFPFRQRRLRTWLEMKEAPESPVRQTSQAPDIPYWQTVGYNLAVKYEARRRQRAMVNSPKAGVPDEKPSNLHRSEGNMGEVSADKSNRKRSSKSTSACMSKLRVGFTNLISKMKEEGNEFSSANSYKAGKPTMLKLKNKSTPSQVAKEKEPAGLPPLPQFLNNDRPLMFYPKYIPFEKERFENDVNKKMAELSEQKINKFV